MAKALTQNPPYGAAPSLPPFLECGDKSPLWPWGTSHPVPALNLRPRQSGGLPESSRGSSAATTPGKLPQPPCTPAGCQKTTPVTGTWRSKILDCGDKSPLWHWGTSHPVLNLRPRQPGGLPDSSRGSSVATTPGKVPKTPCTPAGCQNPPRPSVAANGSLITPLTAPIYLPTPTGVMHFRPCMPIHVSSLPPFPRPEPRADFPPLLHAPLPPVA